MASTPGSKGVFGGGSRAGRHAPAASSQGCPPRADDSRLTESSASADARPLQTVKIGRHTTIEATLIAPERTISVGPQVGDFYLGTIMGKRVRLKGSTAVGSLDACA